MVRERKAFGWQAPEPDSEEAKAISDLDIAHLMLVARIRAAHPERETPPNEEGQYGVRR